MKKSTILLVLLILFLPIFNNFETLLGIHNVFASNYQPVKSFSTNVLLSTNDSIYPQHVEPTLAIGPSDEIFVGWKEALGPASSGVDVSFIKSVDEGKTWTTPVSMPENNSNNEGKSDPWLQVYKDTIYYSYLEFNDPQSPNFYTQVTMARSTDEGATWKTSKASENNLFADKEAFIVSSNGTIYLTYDDVNLQTGLGSIKLSKSIDGGVSFSDVAKITDVAVDDIVGPYPAISSNHTLFVSWQWFDRADNYFGDIYFDYSSTGGKTFNIDRDLNPESEYAWATSVNGAPGKSSMPVMHFDSNDRLYVAWAEFNKNWKINLKYSDDYGKHWSSKTLINDKPNADQWEPDMAIDSNDNIHMVWLEEENNHYRPYYRMLSFTGVNRSDITTSAVIPVASSFTSSSFFRPGDYFTIRLDSNNKPHVVWTDGRSGKLDIYYASGMIIKSNSSSPSFTIISVIIAMPVIIILLKKSKIKE